MNSLSPPTLSQDRYELRFTSLVDGGQGYAFPCDPQGHVDMGGLSDRSRNNYFYARAVKQREFSDPVVALIEPP
jgi:hypothetical protein